VTPSRPGAEDQGTAPEPPQDEYPTETFDAIRFDSGPTSDPADDGADVVDEWEQALRGDASGSEPAAESRRGARSRRGGGGTEQDDGSSQIFDRIRGERTTGVAPGRANGGATGLFGSAWGRDDRVDTAVIPRITDDDPPHHTGAHGDTDRQETGHTGS
jgi:hypothetical protein